LTDPPLSAQPGYPTQKNRYAPRPRSARHGIGLCLSGGGYRATLFHLGALRRLDELGVLSHSEFRTISSVSGGSIAAAAYAQALAEGFPPRANGPVPRPLWNAVLRDPLRAFTRCNLRTPALFTRLLPWNWRRDDAAVRAMASRLERGLTGLRLGALPRPPVFIFCATDMAFGVGFVFSRRRMGDWLAGYRPPPADLPLAQAVAASACFPPVFNPLRLHLAPADLTHGRADAGPERDRAVRGLRLTDGGTYDNMGLEPVWKSHRIVLVSDAGGVFTGEADRGLLWRLTRYQGILERQSRALRKRWLISSFVLGAMQGTYWAAGGARSRYGFDGGYSKELASGTIAEVRTDLDAFSDAEAAVLENHGYLTVDAALRRHVPELAPEPLPPLDPPHPDWLPPRRTEDDVRAALAASRKILVLGRW
jgi:NTE family protein